MSLQFAVDKELCVGCEECVEDCPFGLLEMNDGLPTLTAENEQMCIQCQHCFAVCSTGALSVLGKEPAASQFSEEQLPTAKQMSLLMKGRRSVRRYKQEQVSPEDISFLLETTSYAPTAVNNRQVMFTVIEDMDVMDKLRTEVYAAIETKVQNGTMPEGMEFYLDLIAKAQATGRDAIFQGAPHMVIASSPKESPAPEADCFIALSYFELLAASMGLGALWCGLAKWTLMAIAPEVLARLNIPKTHEVVYMMVFGKPALDYPRTIQLDKPLYNKVQSI